MGGLIRLLFLFAVAWVVSRLLRGLASPAPRRPHAGPARSPGVRPGGPRPQGGELVQDPHCGVYVPKETAVRGADGASFCSEECRRAHEAGRS